MIRQPASGVSRRTALTALALAAGTLATGCSLGAEPRRASGRPRGDASRTAEQDPDVALLALAAFGERFALEAATATLGRHGELAAILTGVRDAHQSHVQLLSDAAPEDAVAGLRSAAASPSPVAPAGPFRVPSRPVAALRRLSLMERDLSLANKRHAFAADSGAFARILASMAASAAQHASVLADATATRPAAR